MPNYGRRTKRWRLNFAVVLLFAAVLAVLPVQSVDAATSAVTLSLRSKTTTSVTVAWTANIYSGTLAGFEFTYNQVGERAVVTRNLSATTRNQTVSGLNPSGTYTFDVRALVGGGVPVASNTLTVALGETVPTDPSGPTVAAGSPTAPYSLTATAVSHTQISLKWTDRSTNETEFLIDRATSSGGPFVQVASVPAGTTAYSDTGLESSTYYYYKVRASNDAGASAYTNTAYARTRAVPPSAPSGLRATPISSTQIKIEWTDNSTNESSFKIERSTSASGAFAQAGSVGANVTSWTNSSLQASTTYYYRVCAYSTAGNSEYAGPVSATTLAAPPTAPYGLTATAVSHTQINLKWTDRSTNETEFLIDRATSSGGPFVQVASVPAGTTAYSDTGLESSTYYYYKVRASNAAGPSAYTNTASSRTRAVPPNAPSGLRATPISSTQIKIEWTDNSTNESSFKIERSTSASGPFTQVGQVGANLTSWTNSSLAASTTYHYRVCAYSTAGSSEYAGPVSGTTLAAPPTAPRYLTAVAASYSQINLKWTDASNNETQFLIERAEAYGGPYSQIAAVPAGTTAYSSTGLEGSKYYYYKVRAANEAGNSAYTNIASARTPAAPPVPPAAPSGLAATVISSSQINLQWIDNSANETGFRIERSTSASGTYAQVGQVGAGVTVFSNTGLTASTTYYYRVYAYGTTGNSAYAGPVNATTFLAPPAAPSSLTAVAASYSQINLQWADNSNNESSFKIERSLSSGGPFYEVKVMTADSTSCQDTGLDSATTYYYRVRACNSGGCSAYTIVASAKTQSAPATPVPPAAPSGLSATAISSSQINLQWIDNSDNENGFRIERSTSAAGGFAQVGQVGAGVTAFSNTELAASTTYFYRVQAYHGSGESAYAGPTSATTLPAPPAAPSGLVATAVSPSQIDLGWVDNSDNESSFKLERGTSATGPFTEIVLGAAMTTYPDAGLSPDTTYYYRVRACNSGGCSAYTVVASAKTQSEPLPPPLPDPPAAPSSLTAIAVSANQINLQWADNASTEQNHKIERAPAGGSFTEICSLGANTTTYSDTGLSASTTYYYRLRACNAAGCSQFTNLASASTPSTPPSAPSGLTGTAVSGSQIRLDWTDNSSNETGFRVERSSSSSGPFTAVATCGANVTSYSEIGLISSTTYYYRICAVNSAGNSAYAGPVSVTTLGTVPLAPSNLVVTSVTSTSITIRWSDNSSNETGFRIQRSSSAAGTYSQMAVVGAGATTYTNTGLEGGATWYYKVSALNNALESASAGPVSGTTLPPIPDPPTFLKVPDYSQDVSSTRIRLVWTDNSLNEQAFVVERSLSDTSAFLEVARKDANTTEYVDTDVTEHRTYIYRVCAVNGVSKSGYSNDCSVLSRLNAPTNLVAIPATPNQVDLSWTDNSSLESGYLIERRAAQGTWEPVPLLPANTTSYQDTGRTGGVTYEYRVCAKGSDSEWATATVETPLEPLNLQWVGKTPVIGEGYKVAMSGDYAYVTSSTGLQIVDISDPARPLVKSSVDMQSPYDVAVDGDLVYVGDGKVLRIVDATDRTSPRLLGSLAMTDYVMGLCVANGKIYVANYLAGLAVVGVENVNGVLTPVKIGDSIDTNGEANAVAVDGNLALVADGSNGVVPIDLTTMTPGTSLSTTDNALDIEISGGVAFVAARSAGVWAVGYTPATGSVPASVTKLQQSQTLGSAVGVAISADGQYAYVASSSYATTANGLEIHYFGDLTVAPARKSFLAVGGSVRGGVAALGGTACIAARTTGLSVIDASDASAPTIAGQLTDVEQATGVVVKGAILYATSTSALNIYDVTEPSRPVHLSCLAMDAPLDIAVSGVYAFVGDNKTLRVVNVADPTRPYVAASVSLPVPDYIYGVCIVGGRAYVAAYLAGLVVLDISNPLQPAIMGSVDTLGQAFAVSASPSGEYVAVADGSAGVQIVDVRNGAMPVLHGRWQEPAGGYAYDVAWDSNRAYVASAGLGMHILDVTQSASPILIGSKPTMGLAVGILTSNHMAFVASSSDAALGNGLQVFDVSISVSPVERCSVQSGMFARSLAVSGNTVYLTDDTRLVNIGQF